MSAGQQFLFALEKPLVKRLGKKFFQQIPQHAGVYKMRDAQDNIVYIGKAKNLRQRLRSYRTANPERLSRRHLRLLQQVTRIEFELCAGEKAALKHEARLIRELKPKFNRAGVWPGKTQFLVWRFVARHLELDAQEIPAIGWERHGSLGAFAPRLRSVLARLLWLAVNPGAGLQRMPYGWTRSQFPGVARIDCGEQVEHVRANLTAAFWGNPTMFLNWLTTLFGARPAFERALLMPDMDRLREFFEPPLKGSKRNGQMALL